jgi:hypothetical protein
VPTTTTPVPSDATNWGDIPTWVGAVGTCVATVAVIVTGVFVFLAFRKQGAQVDLMRDQLKQQEQSSDQQLGIMRRQLTQQRKADREAYRAAQQQIREQQEANERQAEELRAVAAEREREAAQRRRAQAAQIFVTCDRPALGVQGTLFATIHNTSPQPIYKVNLEWTMGGPTRWAADSGHFPLAYLPPGGQVSESTPAAGHDHIDQHSAVVEFSDAAGVRWQRREGGELIEQLSPNGLTAS